MQYRRRLRSRIILSFLIFGTVLSGLFAVSAFVLQDYITDQLISRTLKEELDDYVVQLRKNPSVAEPFYSRIDGYVTRPGKADIVPAPFRDLASGVHEISTNGKSYRAAIRKEDDFWVFLTYDVTADRNITRQLSWALLGVVLVFSALSYGLGRWSSGRVMSPVRELARRVSAMGTEAEPQALSAHFADDEVGQLAEALDDYASRLRELVERDKAFNADVSHELRTPLAVITGATELLLSMPNLPPKAHERLLRIARAARQSADITTALLHLVRAERGTTEDSRARNVGDIVEEVAELHRPLIRAKALAMLGNKLPAEQAENWGLIYQVVEDDALMDEAGKLAAYLATQPTLALANIKKLLNANFDNTLHEQLERERLTMQMLGRTDDYREGVASFLEKRAPEFKGQ